jgi:putative membrane protein
MTDHFAVEKMTSTDLAFERTRLAADRTTMAYMRTSASMIGFGFTIYKFFQYLKETPDFGALPSQGARNIGLALLVLGSLMLVFALIQHIAFVRRLATDSGRRFPFSIPVISSVLLLAVGLLALANIIFRLGPL